MEPRLSLITLGVKDLQAARRFYEVGLGWTVSPLGEGQVVFFQLFNGLVLALYPLASLAGDLGLPVEVAQPVADFCGMTLAYNTHTRDDVEPVLAIAEQAGGRIVKPAHTAPWGGYIGYFADLDGHVWEVAWNPGFTLTPDGQVRLPS